MTDGILFKFKIQIYKVKSTKETTMFNIVFLLKIVVNFISSRQQLN